jgi:hypothetical protein
VLGSPVVHLAHERPVAALASVGMRVIFPIAGAFVGSSTADCRHAEDFCGMDQVVEGVVVGAVLAMLVDDLLLTHETVETEPTTRVTPSTAMVRSPDGKSTTVTFGVSGVF